MSEIDRVLVKDLEGRYHIGKTALYSRLNALKIVPIKDGKRSYVSAEQLGELDELDRRLKAGGTLPQGTESEMGLANSSVGFVEQLPSLSTEQFLELAQAIALMLRPSDLFSNYETLERFAKNRWLIQSAQLAELIGKRPKGSLVQWGGFVMQRQGRYWWSVEKK